MLQVDDSGDWLHRLSMISLPVNAWEEVLDGPGKLHVPPTRTPKQLNYSFHFVDDFRPLQNDVVRVIISRST